MTKTQLRPATEDEREFIFDIYKATLRPYVEWAWGWDEAFQRDGFWKHHPIDQFRVVTVGDTIAGGIHVELQETLNYIRMIFLLPEFQRHGIGAELLLGEIARATAAGKQLHLTVIKINPAKKLYDRLGFVVVEEDDATYEMRLA
jgi:GNAT superfamily N-acetyltransferase